MKSHSLFLALAAAMCVAPAHAVKINDQALTANGGSLADIDGTAPNVFDTLRTASLATQFQAVGRLGDCTATWLGTEGEYAWVLTAARCVPNTNLVQAADALVFTNHEGVALAGGAGSMSYVHPNRINRPAGVSDAGNDIAMVRLKRLPASSTPAAPVLYDGTEEAMLPVGFVAYGSAVAANRSINAVWPTAGERRAWGESIIDGTNNAGHALFANFSAGSATRWAGVDPTDAGSAWWQERNGQWQIVATTSGGSTLQSHGTRVSKYATWINEMFPGVRLASEPAAPVHDAPEVTNTQAYQSHDLGANVGFVKAPDQPAVDAPTATHSDSSGTVRGNSISVPLTEASTGSVRLVVLRAWRTSGCAPISMDNRVLCSGGGSSRLNLQYVAADNPDLTIGQWNGRVLVDGLQGPSATFKARLAIDIAISIAAPSEGGYQSSADVAAPDAYFTVPTQAIANGPTSGHSNGASGHSMITVNARDAVTQATVPVKLRAQRKNGCAGVAMNNAVLCNGQKNSVLVVTFDAADNPMLPAGRYNARFNVQARRWHNKAFNTMFPVNVDINKLP